MKLNVTWFPVQLFELDNCTPPFHRLAVTPAVPPATGVDRANTAVPRFTLSGLEFVTLNVSAGTCVAPGICVESGGVPTDVTTASTGGVAVAVFVALFVAVLVAVLVAVKVFVSVSVAVFVAVLVKVFVAV